MKQNSDFRKVNPESVFLRKIYCLFEYDILNSCITEN